MVTMVETTRAMAGDGSRLSTGQLAVAVLTFSSGGVTVSEFSFGCAVVRDDLANTDHKKVLMTEQVENDHVAMNIETAEIGGN